MRIAYLYEWNTAQKSGVVNKIVTQSTEWYRQKHEVALFNLSWEDNARIWRSLLGQGIDFQQGTWSTPRERMRAMNRMIGQVLDWKPDIIYLRHDIYYPSYERFIHRIPFVVEINTDELNEVRRRSKGAYWYRRITRGRTLARAAGLVFVSYELSESAHFKGYGRPRCITPNGIDLSLYSPLPVPQNDHPRLFFIGQPGSFFHGQEKLKTLAGCFPDWRIDVVGLSAAEFDGALPPNLVVHGLMSRDEYTPLMAQANIALGTLSLHLKGMNEASPLKMAEYLASGLPAIIGCKYTNIMEAVDFILELPNTENNIVDHLEMIERFVYEQMDKRVPREKIQHLDISQTEERRLEFMRSVL